MTRRALLAAALAAVPAAACGNGEAAPAAPDHPPGTAIAVNGVPIPAEEIDAAARLAALVEPTEVFDQHRRYALAGLVVPRAVCRTRFPEERVAALEAAAARLAYERGETDVLPSGTLPGPAAPPVTHEGDVLGLEPWLWGPASELEPGVWSEPLELVGRVVVVRLVARAPGEHPGQDVLTLDVIEHAYVPADTTSADLRDWTDEGTLVVVDPAWEDVVGLHLTSLMRGEP